MNKSDIKARDVIITSLAFLKETLQKHLRNIVYEMRISMKKRILDYRNRVDEIIDNLNKNNKKNENENIDWIMKEHLQQIAFFQHERLIHLIVTITFALITVLSLGIFLLTDNIVLIALILLELVLLVPYIMHYYLLENEVQKMYVQYDKLLKIQKNKLQ